MAFLIAFVVFVALLYLARRRSHRPGSPLGIEGKIVYADQGRKSKLFINKKYGITAKPDFIIATQNGQNVMVEYKSRAGRVYQSDIVQLLASVLAARSEMPIHRAVVVTKGTRREVVLGSDEQIFKEISKFVLLARRAQEGEIIKIFSSHPGVCRSCSVAHSCQR
ncbi:MULTISPECIES: CRISPR-associated protein Cas4 [Aeromonas]|uniref:PD-(D/E)XK nuclease family protein n=1 Tax=Aeromonas caviae TaxID=648 RepID=A0AA42VFZ4_AERCA|nr:MULTISPECIES: PD-(D/E)XK nuclease family protein [Aeromonas]HEB5079310.1 PD-(D/E)XK nuclease family protein [Aeromonas hydrophila subsp. hydrophila]MBP4057276.1 PD-(D/E)XK nuclease family protein [Aeromonas sp. Prich7-2]MCW4617940.1 PD-(D/E)XK nuclease family protein [Aeromonas hydrophila]MDH0309600.1 PD-(D/E)XK nuclease family protein [Aeromonas caviae]MDH0319833.1 PD-(D/E)XK nuclease family protein [Aeromonas caviae]